MHLSSVLPLHRGAISRSVRIPRADYRAMRRRNDLGHKLNAEAQRLSREQKQQPIGSMQRELSELLALTASFRAEAHYALAEGKLAEARQHAADARLWAARARAVR